MAAHFAIEHRLTPAHLAAFQPLLMDRGRTIDDLLAWLRAKGYRISRGAVGNYRKSVREDRLFRFRADPAINRDSNARRNLAAWAAQLKGDDLRQLAQFAVYLLDLNAAAGGASPRGLPGIVPIDAKAHRRAKLSLHRFTKGRKRGSSMAV